MSVMGVKGPAGRPPSSIKKKVGYRDAFIDLTEVDEPGEVAVGGRWSDVCGVMPNLSVEGFGILGLPLSEPEARRLAEVRTTSPLV